MSDKVIIKFKTTESRDKHWDLLTKGCGCECDDVSGGYIVHNGLYDYIGVLSERVTLYFDIGETDI